MDRKEILEKLKITEAEVRRNIDAAQHKKNEMINQAQKQAQKLESDSQRHIIKEREKLLLATQKEMQEKRQRSLKKAYTDVETMKKKLQMKKSIEFFVDKFKEYVHV